MNGKQLKNSILQWAIQGKLVPQDPNEEPASVLLERIREEKTRLVKEKKIKKDKNESIIFRGDDNSHYEKFADGTVKCIDDEIPFEIPLSWCWVRLGNICSYLHRGKSPQYGEHKVLPIIAQKCNQWDMIYTDRCLFSSTDSIKKYKEEQFLQIGDVIINSTGGGTVGRTGYIDSYVFEQYSRYVADSHVTVVRPLPLILQKYIYYFLISPQIQIGLEDRCSGSTNQIELGTNTIYNYLTPVPPIREQRRIVEKIQEVLPVVDNYGKTQIALDKLNADIFDKLKKSVLQEAIQGKLVSQNPKDEPASVLLERIKAEKAKLFKEGNLKKKDLVDSVIFKGEDNKYYETIGGIIECIDERISFELPSNWIWVTLGNLVQNCSGLAYKKENLDERSESYIRVLRGGNIDDGKWSMKDDDVMIASKFVKSELLLTAGTFITPAVTSIEQMGKTALVREDQPHTVVGGFVLMLLPLLRDWSLLNYLELIFKSEYYKGYCRSITNKSGQAFYNLSRQKLMQFLVPLPPLNERIRITEEVAKINSMMR